MCTTRTLLSYNPFEYRTLLNLRSSHASSTLIIFDFVNAKPASPKFEGNRISKGWPSSPIATVYNSFVTLSCKKTLTRSHSSNDFASVCMRLIRSSKFLVHSRTWLLSNKESVLIRSALAASWMRAFASTTIAV